MPRNPTPPGGPRSAGAASSARRPTAAAAASAGIEPPHRGLGGHSPPGQARDRAEQRIRVQRSQRLRAAAVPRSGPRRRAAPPRARRLAAAAQEARPSRAPGRSPSGLPHQVGVARELDRALAERARAGRGRFRSRSAPRCGSAPRPALGLERLAARRCPAAGRPAGAAGRGRALEQEADLAGPRRVDREQVRQQTRPAGTDAQRRALASTAAALNGRAVLEAHPARSCTVQTVRSGDGVSAMASPARLALPAVGRRREPRPAARAPGG